MNVVKKLVGRKRDAVAEASCRRSQQKRKAFSYRPSALVTVTVFDNDEIFSAVANTLIFNYENEGLSERDAINATIFTATEREAFLESLDLRHATIYLHQDEELAEGSPVSDLVIKVQSIFGKSLRSMWRDNMLNTESINHVEDNNEGTPPSRYTRPLKTPKNLHSPIITSSKSSNVLSDNIKKRRTFFPDACEQPRSRTRIRIDFKLSNASNAQPVNSLQLDGFSNAEPLGAYIPPRSPIIKAC
jgi:hypothetical protein